MREYLQKKAFIFVSLVERPRLVSLFFVYCFYYDFIYDLVLSRCHFFAHFGLRILLGVVLSRLH